MEWSGRTECCQGRTQSFPFIFCFCCFFFCFFFARIESCRSLIGFREPFFEPKKKQNFYYFFFYFNEDPAKFFYFLESGRRFLVCFFFALLFFGYFFFSVSAVSLFWFRFSIFFSFLIFSFLASREERGRRRPTARRFWKFLPFFL